MNRDLGTSDPRAVMIVRVAAWTTYVLILAGALYIVVACAAYAFRHPEMTDTQRALAFFDAMMWR